MIPVYLRIRSEYSELDSSKYRLGITESTLCMSLAIQTDQNFQVVLDQSPMDPCWSRRRKAFRNRVDVMLPFPRIEVEVGDDDFLCPTFIESIRKIPLQQKNSFLIFKNGFIFHDGHLNVWRGRDALVETTMWVTHSIHVDNRIEVTDEPSWIHVRHRMNSTILDYRSIKGPIVKNLQWSGWQQNIVQRYCEAQIKTATANGCELHPTKSRSVVFSRPKGRRR